MSPLMLMDLADAAESPSALVGGKGRSLGIMRQLGLPVPEGFVITAPALAAAFADAPRAPTPPAELPNLLAQAIQDELARRGWIGTPLAVRSSAPQEDSAAASFAGIHRSELNVLGQPSLDRAIAAIWSSLWTPQAIAYRARFGIGEADAAMAVVVMPMVPAVAAGVAFTCEPQTGRDDRIVINAVHGLGEALVSGIESGEEIVLEEDRITDDLVLVSRRASTQRRAVVALAEGGTTAEDLAETAEPVLADALALDLGALLRDAAQALDYTDPCYDLEWVWTGERFVLVQARPVTARTWVSYAGLAGQPAIWSNGNTRDVVPHVMAAMEWIGWRRAVDLLLEQGYRLAGFPLDPGASRAALIHGRLYLNASLIQWEGFDAFGVAPKAMNALMGGHHPEIAVPVPTWRDRVRRGKMLLAYLMRSGGFRRRGRRQALETFTEVRRWREEDMTVMSDGELIQRMRRLASTLRSSSEMMFLQGSSGGNLHLLLDLVERRRPGESHALVAAIMAGGEPSVSAQQAYDLLALAQSAAKDQSTRAWLRQGPPWDLGALPPGSAFARAFADFLERYGHRAIYETYLRSPRFREDPAYLLETVAGLLETDPDAIVRRREDAAAKAWRRLADSLPLATRLLARSLVRAARQDGNDRELARSAFTAWGEIFRLMLLEGAERLCRRGLLARREDIFDLTPRESLAALEGRLGPSALNRRIARRRRRMAEWDAMEAPEVVIGGQAVVVETASSGDDGVWRGVAVGSGVGEGLARVIRSPEDGGRLAPGEIMLAPSTDPAWTPLFLKAGGLVMETGGYLSHGAIVAREFGIPAVVNLPGILGAVADGTRLKVDGRNGEVALAE